MPNTKAVGVAFSDPELDGAVLGASGGTVGFYGTTPVVKGAAVTTLATTPTATDIATAVNSIISRLKTIGIIA
jgi:hypothetical protein